MMAHAQESHTLLPQLVDFSHAYIEGLAGGVRANLQSRKNRCERVSQSGKSGVISLINF